MSAPWIAEVINLREIPNLSLTSQFVPRSRIGSCRVCMKHLTPESIFPFPDRFLTRALANEVLDFSDEDDTQDTACPVCSDCMNQHAPYKTSLLILFYSIHERFRSRFGMWT
jgi:hypothetical protein